MKRLLKILGLILLVLILGLLIFYMTINNSEIPSYPTVEFEYTASTDSAGLVRGKRLASMLCAGCHMNQETRQLTGRLMTDAPPEFGKVYAPNITQDETYGIGTYTDAEIKYLLRTGIKKDGQYAPAYMAKLPLMADADIDAIISFLRSDDPMVQAQAVADEPCEPSFLTKFLCKIAWKPYPLPDDVVPLPDTSNSLELGEYFVYNMECFSCHSASFKSNDYLNPELSVGYCGGGNTMYTEEGNVIYTPNITASKTTGIGSWSKERFVNAVKYGSMEGEAPLQIPMQPYVGLSDKEAGAIYDYLMTIPVIENDVERIIYD